MRIQIIENSAKMREMIIKTIGRLDFEYFHCDESDDAIKQCLEIKPNWIIIGLEMKKVSGLVLGFQLKMNFPEAKITLISGYDEYEFKRTAEQYGIHHFILKENLQQLQKIIISDEASVNEASLY